MNIDKIKEDLEIASIDYSDRYTVKHYYLKRVQWIVKDRITKEDKVVAEYNDVKELPKATRKYRNAINVWIEIYDVDKSLHLEICNTIVDKLNIEKDYPYYKKPVYFDWGGFFRISYTLCDPVILSAPKRIK